MAMLSSKAKAISYRNKDKTICPVCQHEFHKEQLHSGGGRLIAGKLTAELRRTYDLNKKYGRVYPIAYSVITCPQCLYSSFSGDFNMLTEDEVKNIGRKTAERSMGIEKIIGPIDFNEDRNLILGAASYILAIDCYQMRNINIAPTPKKAICSLRGAWLFGDMNEDFPGMGFDKVRDFLYLKAAQYYTPLLDIMSTGKEPHDQFVPLLGPDTDQNWGFDGVIYIQGYLTMQYLNQIAKTMTEKLQTLEMAKRFLGKLYGMGRASKNKPTILIDLAKNLYEKLSDRLDKMKEEAGIGNDTPNV
jgi:uncharacterized protein